MIVREHIYEKFTQYSDPISDLDIGYGKWRMLKPGDTIQCIKSFKTGQHEYYDPIYYLIYKIKFEHNSIYLEILPFSDYFGRMFHEARSQILRNDKVTNKWFYNSDKFTLKKLKKHFKIISNHIDEKFHQDSDPVSDMGIGILAQIRDFVKVNTKDDRKYDYCIPFNDVEHIDPTKPTYMLVVCSKLRQENYVKILLDIPDIDVNYAESLAFRWACHWGDEEIVNLFLEKGVNVNARIDSDSPLVCAAHQNNFDIVKLLIENGAIINLDILNKIKNYSAPEIYDYVSKEYLKTTK